MTETSIPDPAADALAAYAQRVDAGRATLQPILAETFGLAVDPAAIDPDGWYVGGWYDSKLASAEVTLPDARLVVEHSRGSRTYNWTIRVVRPCATCGMAVRSSPVYDAAGLGMQLTTFHPATCPQCRPTPAALRAELLALQERIAAVLAQYPTE